RRLMAAAVCSFTLRSAGTHPSLRLLSIYSISYKAKAVPVAASSSAFVSARPTRLEGRQRSLTALRIQDSSKPALLKEPAPGAVDRGPLPFPCRGDPLPEPLLLELGRGQGTQGRRDPFPVVHVVQEPPQLPVRIGEVAVLGQVDL